MHEALGYIQVGSKENMYNLNEKDNEQNHMWFICDDVTAHTGGLSAGIPVRVFNAKSHVRFSCSFKLHMFSFEPAYIYIYVSSSYKNHHNLKKQGNTL